MEKAQGRWFSVLLTSWLRHKKLFAAAFFIALFVSFVGSYLQVMYRYHQDRDYVNFTAQNYLSYVQLRWNELERSAGYLAQSCCQLEGGAMDFPVLAGQVLQASPHIQGAAAAPAGIVSYASNGEMMALGTDLFQYTPAAAWCRDKAQPAFIDVPDTSLKAMLWPVYGEKEGQRYFFGFVILTVLPEAFVPGGYLPGGLAYDLSQRNPWDGTALLLSASEEKLLSQPIGCASEQGGLGLEVRLSPIESWYDLLIIAVDTVLSLAFSLAAALIAVLLYELHEEKHAFEWQSCRDELTGLYNRRMFVQVLAKACQKKDSFLLFYLDLNKFKQVNDKYGHDIGDMLLKACAERLKSCVGDNLLFRIGGDEFVAYMKDPGSEQSRLSLSEEFYRVLEPPFRFGSILLHITVSLGYVLYPRDAGGSEALLRLADNRMYKDKHRSRLYDIGEDGTEDEDFS